MGLLVVALAALAAALVLAWRLAKLVLRVYRMHRLTAAIPGPPAWPLFGCLLADGGLGELSNEGIFDRAADYMRRYGSVYKYWLGPILGVIVAEPEAAQVVLTSPHLQDKPGLIYASAEHIIGKGLVTINGAAYKRHRKAITASLHLDILQDFMPIFNENSRKLVARLDALAGPSGGPGEVFDAAPVMGWAASITACETVLASEAPDLEAERAAYVRTVHTGMNLVLHRALRPWYAFRPLFRLLDAAKCKDYVDAHESVTSYARKVLARKKSKLALGQAVVDGKVPDDLGQTRRRRKTFLDQFLSSDEASVMDEAELIEELKTLLLAASVTSMDFLSLFLFCMAVEPEVQRRVQAELDDVYSTDNLERDVLTTDFAHLPYLECALKEALRYFSPVPVIAREATEDVSLPSGQVLPKGTIVGVVPVMLHRNPRLYPDPLKFDPERFSPEQSRLRHPYAFIPFSAGPRNCIGQRYAMLFAKTVAASVLRHFDVLPDPAGPQRVQDAKIIVGAALSLSGGARVRVQRRAGRAG